MFSRILVATRGEIALRIIRVCRRLGIETVAVYSQADADALYLRLADRTVCIGPGNPSESYLKISNIISAAEVADVEAVHPGYGFLAENSHFADVCRSCQIAFIGPTVETMAALGDKIRAKEIAKKAGAPVVPGSNGAVEDEEAALSMAHEIVYPVILKAAAGGGGRGMRVAHNDPSMVNGFRSASNEARAAFGDSRLYIEKYIERPHHIEIQILADKFGNIIHLGERDCSIQRRHQKLIEESPSPFISSKLRSELGRVAVKIMKKAGYTNAGTVEFMVDKDHEYYFMEVNARVQVEHPVTEMVTEVDIIEQQIRIAAGERLPYRQKDIRIRNAAIECRINAEDTEHGFAPSPGKIETWYPPAGDGIRVDSHMYTGYTVPREYDSLLAKLIVHGKNRGEAIRKMALALDEFIIEGCPTTIEFCRQVMEHERFVSGNYDTGSVEELFL